MLQPQQSQLTKNSIFYDDKYKYIKTLSKNSFNEICLCFNQLNKELCILKVSLPQFFCMNSLNIEKQSNFLEKIKHKNVLKLMEFQINGKKAMEEYTNKCSYLVLEYAQRGELFDYVKYNKGLYYKIALYYFKNLILTLEEIHKYNICHRDLKLENLLLDLDYTLKICDFEFSEQIYRNFETKEYIFHIDKQGTFAYMAPEFYVSRLVPLQVKCFKNEKNDNFKNSHLIFHTGDKVDIFACGVILFIMLTGDLPFISAETMDKNYRMLKDYRYDLFWKRKKNIKHNIPECAKDLLNKIFEFDPEKRISLEEIKKHEFYNLNTPTQEEVKLYMTNIWLVIRNIINKK